MTGASTQDSALYLGRARMRTNGTGRLSGAGRAVFALVVVSTTVALDGTRPLSAQHTEIQCNSIVSNALSNPAKLDTLVEVFNCPSDYGPTFATLLGQTGRLSTDFQTYSQIVIFASQRRESDVYVAAVDIAGDAGAPELARVGALMILRGMLSPGGGRVPHLSGYQNYPSGGAAGGCVASLGNSHITVTEGLEPIPSSAVDDVLTLANTIAGSGAPASVRFVASCLQSLLTPVKVYTNPPPVQDFAPSDFSYVKQCGRKFLLRNSSYATVSVYLIWADVDSYSKEHQADWDNESRLYNLGPRPSGEPYSETTWSAPGNGTSRIVVQTPGYELLLWETPNNTPC